MRFDETNGECPATLGEYLDVCLKVNGTNNAAVEFLNRRIAVAKHGRDEPVLAPDQQMRALLMPMLLLPTKTGDASEE